MLDRFEQVLIEPFVLYRPVEAFDAGILLWLAGLDKPQMHTALHRPNFRKDVESLAYMVTTCTLLNRCQDYFESCVAEAYLA